MNCSIYKVCDPAGVCLYVGRALEPYSRKNAHLKRFPNSVFSIIKEVPLKDGPKSEREIILKFKQIGQAAFNKQIPSMTGKTPIMTLTEQIKALRIGQSVFLKSASERTMALNIAKVLGLRIATRARKSGGFTATRLPE